ncbi:hypothetical protein SAMD00019534_052990 [Acytostelium subglobosum LB1]|uniref:hypothetical protein n=1 Tax=Acytostelium subglobosum LB1 TaxID=1410327 RepID=UPI00064507F3|nr:hypothetical protein SAMD00019534_052990 [Acytostelium subglobosum LB1]GAM22124.1 hypothetical protein SAMD00019534_052990 [Acytostelium subglobosum LB1]|eukprot:XP_012755224.1 hypothetical protein SAMD00019534_052990 [Acytostelium subglobosum LB1]
MNCSEIEAGILNDHIKYDKLLSIVNKHFKQYAENPVSPLKILILVKDATSIGMITKIIQKTEGIAIYPLTTQSIANCIICSLDDICGQQRSINWKGYSVIIEFDYFTHDQCQYLSTYNVYNQAKIYNFVLDINSVAIEFGEDRQFNEMHHLLRDIYFPCHNDDVIRKNTYEPVNIKKMSLNKQLEQLVRKQTKDTLKPDNNHNTVLDKETSLHLYHHISLVAGESILKRTHMINHLEKEYNMTLIERTVKNVDIVFDERNGLMVVDHSMRMDNVIDALIELSLQFNVVWIIIEMDEHKLFSAQSKDACRQLSSILNFLQCRVYIRYTFSYQQSALLIREICESIPKDNSTWENNEYKWLSNKSWRYATRILGIPERIEEQHTNPTSTTKVVKKPRLTLTAPTQKQHLTLKPQPLSLQPSLVQPPHPQISTTASQQPSSHRQTTNQRPRLSLKQVDPKQTKIDQYLNKRQ